MPGSFVVVARSIANGKTLLYIELCMQLIRFAQVHQPFQSFAMFRVGYAVVRMGQ